MARTLWLLGIGLALAAPLRAQGLFDAALAGADQEPEGSLAAGTGGVELNGYVRGACFAGKVPDQAAAEAKALYGEAALKLRARTGSFGDAFAEARVRGGLTEGDQAAIVDLREAYVNLYAGWLDLRLGRQIVAWGRADALNPTDNVTPRDMGARSAFEDDRRLGNWAARAHLDLRPLRLEGVWVPVFRASRLPPLALPGAIAFVAPDEPGPELANGSFGGRVHYEGRALDASASYLYGYAPVPGLTFAGLDLGGATPVAQVRLSALRHHVAGVDFATAVSDWFGLRGEAAFRWVPDYQAQRWLPRPEVQAVLGVDREIGDVSVIVQYAGRVVIDPDEPPHGVLDLTAPPSLPPGLSEMPAAIVDVIHDEAAWMNRVLAGQTARHAHAITARVEWRLLHETLSLQALGSFNVTTREWMARPVAAWQVEDALTLTAGAELYGGPDETLFGMVDETLSAGFFELKASY